MSISFLCSVLESVLMSTPLSYITMREDEGYKAATLFKKYKMDNARAIAIGSGLVEYISESSGRGFCGSTSVPPRSSVPAIA